MVTDRIVNAWNALLGKTPPVIQREEPEGPRTYNNIFTVSYTGEKNQGEIGPIIDYRPDYPALRFRSWQAYLESEIAQTVLKKFSTWVIGSGLKLQAEPVQKVLESEKISFSSEEFNEIVEARFGVYAKSKLSDYAGMRRLHKQAKRAFMNAIIGGDVLVILRYIDNHVKVQLVDGAHVGSPIIGSDFFNQAKQRGHSIRHGVEVAPNGQHVAYYVKTDIFKYERIPARGESGLQMAFLVYGLEYRLDEVRGMPLISAVLETMKKLERYKEATVGSAEERQKIAYTIEHGIASTGETPLQKTLARAMNADADINGNNPVDIKGNEMAREISVSTNKMAFNMPVDSKLVSHESKNELYFRDFYTINIDMVCSALEMPPEVALSKYNSNFSASRAALKDWEHTVLVNRNDFSGDFYHPIYVFWLHVQILMNKVNAPGYLDAYAKGKDMIIESYRNARFVGTSVPHIDPLKEVNAERLKLGDTGKSIPLTTVEAATEALNGGDSDQNMKQYADELKESRSLGIQLQSNKPANAANSK